MYIKWFESHWKGAETCLKSLHGIFWKEVEVEKNKISRYLSSSRTGGRVPTKYANEHSSYLSISDSELSPRFLYEMTMHPGHEISRD